jgi:type IV pilus assembly protein PilY1
MLKSLYQSALAALLAFGLCAASATADDTCIFAVTADDVPPNVVLLLDSGAEMEQIIEYSGYISDTDYTPSVVIPVDGVNGFFNERGYAIVAKNATTSYLRPIGEDLNPSASGGVTSDSVSTWTINGRTLHLPKAPSAVVDANGIKDNATRFRFSKNYLNYLFFGPYATDSALHNGTDLPSVTRFYMAKKAIFQVARETANKAKFGLYYFVGDSGASSAQPLKMVVNEPLAAIAANNVLDSNFVNNVNNMGTNSYSPLAEGLADVGGYYASPSSGLDPTIDTYCQKNFSLVISAGVSSMDRTPTSKAVPDDFNSDDKDSDGDSSGSGSLPLTTGTVSVPLNVNGSTWLDDVAAYLYKNDIPGYVKGFQNILTYTVGVMTTPASRDFLINTSNNGNGNENLYDTTDPEYGKYHFDADSPDAISDALSAALNSILSRTATFTAPVVPVTRTSSGDYIYLAFFKPLESNFWEGNITKFGLNSQSEIVDKNGNAATWPNGAMRETAVPYWSTLDWADASSSNYMDNTTRNIYTYFPSEEGYTGSVDLTAARNAFTAANSHLDATVLANPSAGASPVADLINYIRGADSYDEDQDGNTTENRSLITGDALHVEPAIFSYTYRFGGGDTTTDSIKKLFYSANDGMLHVVNDETGVEDWGFVPPGQLARLKLLVEGASHEYFVDSSPRLFFLDHNGDGIVDIQTDGLLNADVDDRVILVFGERKGGTDYYAIDVTYPDNPVFLWQLTSASLGENGTALGDSLGETWSEPVFGRVKTSDAESDAGTWVMFVGGGYGLNNSRGNSILAVDVLSGAVVRSFRNQASDAIGMDYSIISNITLVDADSSAKGGFVDKIYVGDLGGNLWRVGKFSSTNFYSHDENINNWQAQILFRAGCDESSCSDGIDNDADGLVDERRQFQYAPDVSLEWGYDLLFLGSGDRDIACQDSTNDRFYAVKDNHIWTGLGEADLVNVRPSSETTAVPQLDLYNADVDNNNIVDKGWYYPLANGEKALAEAVVFSKAVYFTTFIPNDDPCIPGGNSYIYALGYKTGAAVFGDLDSNGLKDDKIEIGGGIGSKPVVVIKEGSERLLISVGSTNPDEGSESSGAGVVSITPDTLPHNFFFIWWREIFK